MQILELQKNKSIYTYNDINPEIINFLADLLEDKESEKLQKSLINTDYSVLMKIKNAILQEDSQSNFTMLKKLHEIIEIKKQKKFYKIINTLITNTLNRDEKGKIKNQDISNAIIDLGTEDLISLREYLFNNEDDLKTIKDHDKLRIIKVIEERLKDFGLVEKVRKGEDALDIARQNRKDAKKVLNEKP